MSARTRLIVMTISAPVVAFAIVGGFLGKVMAREDTYQHLKIFDDVVGLVSSNYVEEADMDKVMRGAMRGLAEGLDPDSAYLTPDQVRQVESGAPPAPAGVGLELTRQYYLRVIAARDNSPAAKAGLRAGDYIRMINETPTREMSVWEGMRVLRGVAGSKLKLTVIRGNAADPHVVELTREVEPSAAVSGRVAAPGVGYIRIAAIDPDAAGHVKSAADDLRKNGAAKLIVDVRRTSSGSPEEGLAIARLFVPSGTLAIRESKGGVREPIAASSSDATISAPTVVLIDTGHDRTRGTAEADQTSRWQRPVALDAALPHAFRRAAARKRPRPDRGGRRTGRHRIRRAAADCRSDSRQGDRTAQREESRLRIG
ncbi:MAG: hypothetical protein DMG03_19665 [Acidobacteria bacterium]|nr:MAG: hypothetical protein DMG03_19665 [Acidobacteriota bacterium]